MSIRYWIIFSDLCIFFLCFLGIKKHSRNIRITPRLNPSSFQRIGTFVSKPDRLFKRQSVNITYFMENPPIFLWMLNYQGHLMTQNIYLLQISLIWYGMIQKQFYTWWSMQSLKKETFHYFNRIIAIFIYNHYALNVNGRGSQKKQAKNA